MSTADRDSAIIGVAFELPGCSTWAELERVLSSGVDRVGPYPEPRVSAMGLVRGGDDAGGCWQEGLGEFDHRYFGLSRADAELIDPRQRRMLTLAVSAMGNAGYAPSRLRGSDTALVVAGYCAIQPTLLDLIPAADRDSGRAFAGSLPAYSAGRLAYHLDLRGPAFVVDTACSSFLVALHEARWKLARGESAMVLVGGYTAMLGDIPTRPTDGAGMGVGSRTDHCRPFDAAADGTVIGEGGGFVLLKRLADALRDGDAIHAVLRGSALNQDAARSNGLTSPSPVAQAEVIAAALRDADLDPASVGYVEAHGTGTRIGDPIEMRALAQTYGARPTASGSRPVSSVKSYFGHLDAMAGFAGLVRIIAQFRTGQVYPTAHFRALNPLIDLAGAALHVAVATQPWPAGPEPRRAGLSAFGLSGTNAHVIVEEPPQPTPRPDGPARNRVVVVSAPTQSGLRLTAERVRDTTVRSESLDAIADVLAAGRDHFAHRYAWIARSTADLAEQIGTTLSQDEDHRLAPAPVVLVLGDGAAAGAVAAQRTLLRVVTFLTGAARFGVRFDLVLAHGTGVLARKVADGELDLSTAMDAADQEAAAPNRERLEQALGALSTEPALVDLTPDAALSRLVADLLPLARRTTPDGSLEEVLALLYRQGRDIDWRSGIGEPFPRMELPVAPLAQQPCWPAVRVRVLAAQAPAGDQNASSDSASVGEAVLRITSDLLKEELTLSDDFFARGGDSLNGALLVARLNQRFATDLTVLELYELPDLAAVAGAITAAMPGCPAAEPTRERLSGQQLAIWTAVAFDPDSDAYNVPAAFLIDGEVDPRGLEASLAALVSRHDMLRCSLEDRGDGPHQRVANPIPGARVLRRLDLDFGDRRTGEAWPDLLARLQELISEPFRLYDEPGCRFHLIRARFREYVQQVLVLNFHHLFFDGWSWSVVMDELETAGPAGQAGGGYLAYVRDQEESLRGERGEWLHRFWAEYLSGAVLAQPPADRPSQGPVTNGADLEAELDGNLMAALREICKAERVSLNMVFTAVWATLQWRLSGQRDICVAMPIANRRPGDETVIGCFVNTVLVRVGIDPDGTFRDLLAHVRERSLQAIGHGHYPIERILRAAPSPDGQSAAATMLGFVTAGSPRRLGPTGPLLLPLNLRQAGAQFPLELTVLDGPDKVSLVLKYATELFDADTAASWLDRVEGLLHQITQQGTGIAMSTFGAAAALRPSVGRSAVELPAVELPDFEF